MNKYLILILFLPISAVFAQKYPVSAISAELKEKAHAVIREHKTFFSVKDIGSATTRVEGAITILDEKGDEYSTLAIPYNKFTKVNDQSYTLAIASGTIEMKDNKVIVLAD